MLTRLILILSMVAAVMFATPAHAETTWTLWGGAPYATSQDEAVGRLPEALRTLNIPEAVRSLLEAEVRANPQGTRVYLNPGDRFVAMMSGPDRRHASAYAMTDVVVGTNQGPRAGIVQSPVAREWRVTYEGQTYVLVLPDICNNWAWRVIAAPRQEIAEPCAEIELSVQPGDTLLFVTFSTARPPPSRCWAFNQSGEWEALPGGCMQCVNWEPVVARVPEAADRNISMQSRIDVREDRIRIRVPVWAEGHHLGFYLIRNEESRCSWVIVPPNVWQAHTAHFSEWRWRPQGS